MDTTTGTDDRRYWLNVLTRLSDPVLTNLAAGRLKEKMPVECASGADRASCSHLEALGRLLAGIAPWLEGEGVSTEEEENLRQSFADLARQGIRHAVDPQSPDYMNFNQGRQPLVDAAFLAHAIVRAPNELWAKLDGRTQDNLIAAWRSTRAILPSPSNWLLFGAMVETALYRVGEEEWDAMRVDYAVRQHEQWYKGDGIYGDGAEFHWDYYNSFVIQPMLLDVLETVPAAAKAWEELREKVRARARRYAAIQERLISPEGTFPAIGRSLAYRFGAFQLLAQMALRRELPEDITPAQVRCALSVVIRRMIEAPGTFDENGWLTIGFCGHQPGVGERYISTGSLYLCSVGLLPLGLPPSDEFWSARPADWTSRKIWSGQDMPVDHAL